METKKIIILASYAICVAMIWQASVYYGNGDIIGAGLFAGGGIMVAISSHVNCAKE